MMIYNIDPKVLAVIKKDSQKKQIEIISKSSSKLVLLKTWKVIEPQRNINKFFSFELVEFSFHIYNIHQQFF